MGAAIALACALFVGFGAVVLLTPDKEAREGSTRVRVDERPAPDLDALARNEGVPPTILGPDRPAAATLARPTLMAPQERVLSPFERAASTRWGGRGAGALDRAEALLGQRDQVAGTLEDLARELEAAAGAPLALAGGLGQGQSEALEPDVAGLKAQERFLEGEARPVVYASLEQPAGRLVLQRGAIVPVVLQGSINTDLGNDQVVAVVRRPVWDSITGRELLMPQGTKWIGETHAAVVQGQTRVLIAFDEIQYPDGQVVSLPPQPGADLMAAVGLNDKVNNHFVKTFGGALAMAAISAGVQLSQPERSTTAGVNDLTTRQVLAAAVGQELGRVSTELLRRNLRVPPTLIVRTGYEFNIELMNAIVFDRSWRAAR